MIGVGIDAVDIDRFRNASASLIDRLFTETERAYANQFQDPGPSFAARFAAKEATMKSLAVGLGAFGFHDVEVINADSGAPVLNVVGDAHALANTKGVTSFHLSLTHTDSTATAIVIAE